MHLKKSRQIVSDNFYSAFRLQLVSNILVGGLFCSLALAWSRLYYATGPSLIERVSFTSNDPSWMPPGIEGKPILGNHFFGDLELLFGWAKSHNPYNFDLSAQFLPVGRFLLLPFAYLPTKLGFTAYFVISITLFFYAWYRLFKNKKFGGQAKKNQLETFPLQLFFLSALLTLPFLVDIDRGNLYTISISCLILAFISAEEKKWNALFIWLLIAIAFKFYLVLSFILASYFFFRNSIKKVFKIFLGVGLINGLCLLSIPGSPIRNLVGLAHANARYGGHFGVGYIMNSGSVAGAFARWLEQLNGSEWTFQYLNNHLILIQLIGFVYLVLAISVGANNDVQNSFRLFAILGLISFLQPGSGTYTWNWIPFVLLVWIFEKSPSKRLTLNDILLLAITCAGAIPIWLQGNHILSVARNYPQYLFLAPLAILLLLRISVSNFAKKPRFSDEIN